MARRNTALIGTRRNPQEVLAWLQRRPSIAELRAAYPFEWRRVEQELADVAARGPDAVNALVADLSQAAPVRRALPRGQEVALLSAQIRRVMAATALNDLCFTAATGAREGKVRFNLVNGYLAQKLLFAKDLERKPVSLLCFRALWPLIWQRRLLMPLVQAEGIYCFYSKPLVRELARLIGHARCVEIAAGDGTLTRFLADEGVAITATDDYSWRRHVRYPKAVQRQDARTALRAHRPEVVICSWPPAWNTFERDVFETKSVRLYIAINGRSEHSSGNRADYGSQQAFELAEHPKLSRLVLPPELDPVVHVFRRREHKPHRSRS